MKASTLVTLLGILVMSCIAVGSAAAMAAERPAAAGTSKVPTTEAPAWPSPPAEPRIRYARSVTGAADWGAARGFFGRLADTITGRHEAHLVRPTGVAERAGVLYVADPGAQALFVFDSGRRKVIKVDRVGDRRLVSPIAVALGPDDTVFLVDSRLQQVFAIGRNGKLLRIVVEQGLQRPAAVAYDSARQRLYVADSMAHRISVYGLDGRALASFGTHGLQDGSFNSPTHLALAPDGTLLVTDALNFRIQAFDPDGRFLRKFGSLGDGAGNFAAPKGVAADRLGQIYVADALFDAIQIFDGDGQLLLGFGAQGTQAGQFWLPNGLFMSDQDVLYVADAYNRRIQVFQLLPAQAAKANEP